MMGGSERMSLGRGCVRPHCPPPPVVGDWSTVTVPRDELLGLSKGLGHGRRIDHPIHGIKPLDYDLFDYEDVKQSSMRRAIQFSYWSLLKTPPGSPVAQSNKYGGAPTMFNDGAQALLCNQQHEYQSVDAGHQYIAQHSNTRGIGDNGSSWSPAKTPPSFPVMGAWQEMPKGKGRGRGLFMIRNPD